MQLGSHKPLGIPLKQTVQRFERPPLGQFTGGKSLQRRPLPTLGQKLQARFEQNDRITSSESANTFDVFDQSVEAPFAKSRSAEPPDRTEPSVTHSALASLTPLGKHRPLAVRQPLTQLTNLLSLEESQPKDQTRTSPAANLGQLKDKGTAATPKRISRQVQTQIQMQLEQRSPNFEDDISIQPAASSTNLSEVKPQVELASSRLTATETDTQVSSPQILQRQVEPQQPTTDQSEPLTLADDHQNFTVGKGKTSASEDRASASQTSALNLEAPVPVAFNESQSSDFAASQLPDQAPAETSQSTTVNQIQRFQSSVKRDQEIASSQSEIDLAQQSRSNLVEQSQVPPQPSTLSKIQQLFEPLQLSKPGMETDQPQSTNRPQAKHKRSEHPIDQPASQPSIQPQIQARQEPTVEQENVVETTIPTLPSPIPSEGVSAPVQEPAIQQKPLSGNRSTTQALSQPELSAPSASLQRLDPAALKAQETTQTQRESESKPTAQISELATSSKQPPSVPNEAASPDSTSAKPTAETLTSEQPKIQPADQEPALQAKAELADQLQTAANSPKERQHQRTSLLSDPLTSRPIETSTSATVQLRCTRSVLLQRQPLGLVKPLAEASDLLMPKLDLQRDKVNQQPDFAMAEPASAKIAPSVSSPKTSPSPVHNRSGAWSNIDELLNQSNASTAEPWQQQFGLQSPVSEELVSPIAERSIETTTVNSQSAHSVSPEGQHTLTSPISTSTQQNQQDGEIDEQQLELLAQLVYSLVRDQLAIGEEHNRHIVANHPPWIDIISPEFFKSIKLTPQPNSPNAQQQPTSMTYPPQRQLEELTHTIYRLIQQKLAQDRERSR